MRADVLQVLRVLKGNGRDDDYMIMIDTDGLDWCLQGLARALGTPP
jgi:hypothetical protein